VTQVILTPVAVKQVILTPATVTRAAVSKGRGCKRGGGESVRIHRPLRRFGRFGSGVPSRGRSAGRRGGGAAGCGRARPIDHLYCVFSLPQVVGCAGTGPKLQGFHPSASNPTTPAWDGQGMSDRAGPGQSTIWNSGPV
jgi:hypothetical protein